MLPSPSKITQSYFGLSATNLSAHPWTYKSRSLSLWLIIRKGVATLNWWGFRSACHHCYYFQQRERTFPSGEWLKQPRSLARKFSWHDTTENSEEQINFFVVKVYILALLTLQILATAIPPQLVPSPRRGHMHVQYTHWPQHPRRHKVALLHYNARTDKLLRLKAALKTFLLVNCCPLKGSTH